MFHSYFPLSESEGACSDQQLLEDSWLTCLYTKLRHRKNSLCGFESDLYFYGASSINSLWFEPKSSKSLRKQFYILSFSLGFFALFLFFFFVGWGFFFVLCTPFIFLLIYSFFVSLNLGKHFHICVPLLISSFHSPFAPHHHFHASSGTSFYLIMLWASFHHRSSDRVECWVLLTSSYFFLHTWNHPLCLKTSD